MRGEWGGSIPPSSDSGVWENVMSSLYEVQGGAQAENGFIVILYRQITSVDSR